MIRVQDGTKFSLITGGWYVSAGQLRRHRGFELPETETHPLCDFLPCFCDYLSSLPNRQTFIFPAPIPAGAFSWAWAWAAPGHTSPDFVAHFDLEECATYGTFLPSLGLSRARGPSHRDSVASFFWLCGACHRCTVVLCSVVCLSGYSVSFVGTTTTFVFLSRAQQGAWSPQVNVH